MKKIIQKHLFDDRQTLHKEIFLPEPYVVYIELSGKCNLQCFFCPQSDESSKNIRRDNMSIELFHKVIDDLSCFKNKIKLRVKITLEAYF